MLHRWTLVDTAGRTEHLVVLLETKRSHQWCTATRSTSATKAVLSMNLPRWDLSNCWRLTHLGAVNVHGSNGTASRRTGTLRGNVWVAFWARRHALRHWRRRVHGIRVSRRFVKESGRLFGSRIHCLRLVHLGVAGFLLGTTWCVRRTTCD